MKLSIKHLDLYETILERGIGGRCSDLNPNELEMLTKEEWSELSIAFCEWNDDPQMTKINHMSDFMVVDFIQMLLIQSYMEVHGL